VFFALGNGLLWPSYLSILSAQGSSEEQGSIQGYGSSFGSLASIIGLLAGSLLFSKFGSTVFVASALIFVFVGLQGLVLNLKPAN
ncbi:MAG: MFS transporter, partial [Pseudomonadota bacterium]